MYADAQFKWSPEVTTKPEDFKQQYTLDSLWANFQGPGDFNPTSRSMVVLYLGLSI